MNATLSLPEPPRLDLDECEAHLLTLPPVDCPVTHSFVPGFYVRTIFMPKGTILASRIHAHRNPFWITKGVVEVQANGVTETLRAPHIGITEPGTRRLLYIHEDCVWTTFHANPDDERRIEVLERMLTHEHINSVVGLDHGLLKELHPSMHDDLESLREAELTAGGLK